MKYSICFSTVVQLKLYIVTGNEDDMKTDWLGWLFSRLTIWLLNAFIMACVMTKIFVFGEPVTKPLTKSSVSYWRSRNQADAYLARVSS